MFAPGHADGPPTRNATLQSQSAILTTLRPDRRQHASGRFFSALQCLPERHREGVVGCDQLVAFHGWIAQADSWARLGVVSALCAHIILAPTLWSRVAAVAG